MLCDEEELKGAPFNLYAYFKVRDKIDTKTMKVKDKVGISVVVPYKINDLV